MPTSVKCWNAGWRGLFINIDMIMGASTQTEPWPEPGPDARLDGQVVGGIWPKLRLESGYLPDIWCTYCSSPHRIEAIFPH